MSWVNNWFKSKPVNVDEVLKPLGIAVSELYQVEDHHKSEIERATKQLATSTAEAQRARRVSDKLSEILG